MTHTRDGQYVPYLIWLVIVGFFVIFLGSFWHEFYPQSGENGFVGLIAPVNESVWEHVKLIVYPLLILFLLSIIFFGKILNNWGAAILFSTVLGMSSMIIIHYIMAMNEADNLFEMIMGHIYNYFFAMVIAFVTLYGLFVSPSLPRGFNEVCTFLYLGIIIMVTIFTTYPPDSAIFQDQSIN